MTAKLPDPSVLKEQPNDKELQRLVENYPSYEWEHRNKFLYGYFQGKTLEKLLEAKLHALGIDAHSLSPQSLGGHAVWVRRKVKKAFVRILYLRYRIDDGLTREEANWRLREKFGSDKARDKGASAIRKMTEGAKIDMQ